MLVLISTLTSCPAGPDPSGGVSVGVPAVFTQADSVINAMLAHKRLVTVFICSFGCVNKPSFTVNPAGSGSGELWEWPNELSAQHSAPNANMMSMVFFNPPQTSAG